jgi:YidC/Oxa1 family membrane protein insertase
MEKRLILFFILSFMIIQTMMFITGKNQPQPQQAPGGRAATTGLTEGSTTATTTLATPLPSVDDRAATPDSEPAAYEPGPLVNVRTDLFDIDLATNGATPYRWDIIDARYVSPANGDGASSGPLREALIDPALHQAGNLGHPFQIVLQETANRYYEEFNRIAYRHEVVDGNGLIHRFTSPPNAEGVQLIKTWKFERKSFLVGLSLELINQGQSNLRFGGGERGMGLVIGPGLGRPPALGFGMGGLAVSNAVVKSGETFLTEMLKDPGQPAQTITMDATRKFTRIDWGGVESLYFLSVAIPDGETRITAAEARLDPDLLDALAAERIRKNPREGRGAAYSEAEKVAHFFPTLEVYGDPFMLGTGERQRFDYTLYLGPKQQERLKEADHDLAKILFHTSWGWFRALCLMLMWLLFRFHDWVGNWGVAIIMLTIFVKIIALPLVHKGMKAQARTTQEMNKIKPLIEKLNEKYQNDPQRKQQELWKLYREHNINPLGMLKGCGWMMVQIPIFVALYRLLYQSIDLRGADFLWVGDLSQPDMLFALPFTLPIIGGWFNLLPLITAVSQMLTSKFMQTPATDPQQVQMQKMMTWMMPFFILIFTYSFPAGLMLYWLVSNFWQVLQQLYVNKIIKKPEPARP